MANPVQMQIVGLPQLQARLNALQDIGSQQTMQIVAQEFVQAAQETVPVETGNLRESIKPRAVFKKVAVVTAGGPEAPYAKAQEYGASPHPIGPRRARRLRFYWKREGRMFVGNVGQAVNHPGNRAQPFFQPVVATFNATRFFAAEIVKKWNRFG